MESNESICRKFSHWHPDSAIFSVPFRLDGSLTQAVLAGLQSEYDREKHLTQSLSAEIRVIEQYITYKRCSAQYDHCLEQAKDSPQWLADPQIAQIEKRALHVLHRRSGQ